MSGRVFFSCRKQGVSEFARQLDAKRILASNPLQLGEDVGHANAVPRIPSRTTMSNQNKGSNSKSAAPVKPAAPIRESHGSAVKNRNLSNATNTRENSKPVTAKDATGSTGPKGSS
jgi:hypothetical protein